VNPAIPAINVDVAIIGGGIAGLWLLARLRERGYGVVLIEADRLGSGQTICAQGIIHGGAKYSLHGSLSDSAQAIAGMPARWWHCLSGAGEVDLREARLLADHQYLWATSAPSSRLTAFFASKLMQSRMEKVEKVADDLPATLQHPQFRGVAYRLDEPIVDVASVLTAFAHSYQDALLFSPEPISSAVNGTLTLHHPDRLPLTLLPACIVFTAGTGNTALPWAAQQLRPLHMVMARGVNLPGPLYAHCLGVSDTPRVTVTSHTDAEGRLIWYLGGGLAETGVKRNRGQQIQVARQELTVLLPWVDWTAVQFATFTVQRAEARQPGGVRPACFSLRREGRIIAAWPTKLALAPLLAEQLEQQVRTLAVQPQPLASCELADWPRPEIAISPWDREELAWS
jgi:hypothetical protein